MKVLLLAVIGLGLVASGYCFGQYHALHTSTVIPGQENPVVVDNLVYVDRVIEVPGTVEKTYLAEKEAAGFVEIVATVHKETTRTVYPGRFTTVEAAEEWIFSHRLPVVLITDEEGTILLDRVVSDSRYDCDDYADDYEKMALSENISLWQAPVTNGKIWGVQVTENTEGNHVGLWTKIDGVYYYIEPGPTSDEWRLVKIMAAD